MNRRLPQYVHGFLDRHGTARHYLRRPGYKRVALPGMPFSEPFMIAYAAAMSGDTAPAIAAGASRTKPGTINALVLAYYNAPAFKGLEPITQSTYRNIIERFRAEHGDKRVAMLGKEHIKKMLADRETTPAAAKHWLRLIRMLMQFAIAEGMRNDDPTVGVKSIAYTAVGFHPWNEDEVSKFEAKHPIGGKPRLAMALMLYVSGRRSDAVKLGQQHIKNGLLTCTQQKNRRRKPVTLTIPVHPELQRIIDATPSGHLTFLMTEYGKPYTAKGFGNWFAEACDKAGLPQCRAHGLRKAAARRLAEAGCTESQIAAITGHRDPRMIALYTRDANQARMASAAMATLLADTPAATETGTAVGKPA